MKNKTKQSNGKSQSNPVALGLAGMGVASIIGLGTISYNLSQELSLAHDELKLSQEQRQTLKGEIAEFQSQVSDLQGNVELLGGEKEELQKTVEQLEGDIIVFSDTVSEYQNIVNRLEGENSNLKKSIARLRNEASSRRAQLTQNERELLARLIFDEGNTEPEAGQKAIVNVVLNRLDDDRFPDTVWDVVYQPLQFSGAWRLHTHPVLDEHLDVIENVLTTPDNTNGALFFVNHRIADPVAGGWHHTREYSITIGQHVFRR